LALAFLCQSYHSILCSQVAHVETDECGAPEFFSNGTKILLLPTTNGKVSPESIQEIVLRRSDIHFPKPRVLSLTQATEAGTVYSIEELTALTSMARLHKLSVHMDGARFANAAATLDRPPREFTWEAGIDVLCFGGTKMGLPVGEAVVFFRRDLAEELPTGASNPGNWLLKCDFWLPHGLACWKTGHGFVTRPMPTRWPSGSIVGFWTLVASRSSTRAKRTPSSLISRDHRCTAPGTRMEVLQLYWRLWLPLHVRLGYTRSTRWIDCSQTFVR